MERNVHRDRHLIPELNDLMRIADSRLDAASAAYSELIGGTRPDLASVRLLVRLALEFRTWEVLAHHGMPDIEIAKLMRRAVSAVSAYAT